MLDSYLNVLEDYRCFGVYAYNNDDSNLVTLIPFYRMLPVAMLKTTLPRLVGRYSMLKANPHSN